MEKLPPCCYRVSVKALIFDETRTKILLFKEDGDMRSLPGGGLEFGHTPHEDIKREIREEAGLEVIRIDKNPLYVINRQRHDEGIWLVHILYEAKVKDLDFTPSNECLELGFFTKQEALQLKRYSHTAIDLIDF